MKHNKIITFSFSDFAQFFLIFCFFFFFPYFTLYLTDSPQTLPTKTAVSPATQGLHERRAKAERSHIHDIRGRDLHGLSGTTYKPRPMCTTATPSISKYVFELILCFSYLFLCFVNLSLFVHGIPNISEVLCLFPISFSAFIYFSALLI